MKLNFDQLLSDEMRQAFRSVYKEDAVNMEIALTLLRSKGVSQLQSVLFLYDELKLPFREADWIVLHSSTWTDMHHTNIQFRNSFFEELEKYKDDDEGENYPTSP